MRIFTFLVILISFWSCHTKSPRKTDKKKASDSLFVEVPDIKKPKLVLNMQNISWKTFSVKSNTSYADGKHSYDFRMNIRMEKGKYIWISATLPLGIEVARAYIGKDTIKIMDRINGTYLITDYSYLKTYTTAPLNLEMLQSILIGMPTFSPELAMLDTAAGWMSGTLVEAGVTHAFFSDLLTNRLVKNMLTNLSVGQEIKIDYDKFQPTDGYYLPTNLQVNGQQGTKTMEAELNYSNLILNKMIEAPFRIPESYSPMKP